MKKNIQDEPFVVEVKNSYPKIRKLLVFILFIAMSLAPLIELPHYKTTVIMSLGTVLLFLFFDIYNELNSKLSNIELLLAYGEPEYYNEFSAAEQEMNKSILDKLMVSDEINLSFLTVSASYSWRFFEDVIRHVDNAFPKETKRITVSFGLVHPDHFDHWKLDNWKRKAITTIDEIQYFKQKYNNDIESNLIKLNVYLFDNIPHWHGLLINNSVLYLGRTEWEFPNSKRDDISNLLVGQIEYRKFLKNDRFGGERRIKRFESWVRRYQIRHHEIEKKIEFKKSLTKKSS